MTSYAYADVIIDISHEKVDRAFQYGIQKGWKPKFMSECASVCLLEKAM